MQETEREALGALILLEIQVPLEEEVVVVEVGEEDLEVGTVVLEHHLEEEEAHLEDLEELDAPRRIKTVQAQRHW